MSLPKVWKVELVVMGMVAKTVKVAETLVVMVAVMGGAMNKATKAVVGAAAMNKEIKAVVGVVAMIKEMLLAAETLAVAMLVVATLAVVVMPVVAVVVGKTKVVRLATPELVTQLSKTLMVLLFVAQSRMDLTPVWMLANCPAVRVIMAKATQ